MVLESLQTRFSSEELDAELALVSIRVNVMCIEVSLSGGFPFYTEFRREDIEGPDHPL